MLTIIAVLATQAIANVVKSSFGPSGLDKMMVDDIGVSLLSLLSLLMHLLTTETGRYSYQRRRHNIESSRR